MNQDTKLYIGIGLSVVAAVALIDAVATLVRKLRGPVQPVVGDITSPFGHRSQPVAGASANHAGVDVGVPVGTEVRAPWSGTVAAAYTDTQYGGGKTMIIDHDNGARTGYCHLSDFLADKGQHVKAGQTVCLTGNSGRTSGPHLHFTLRLTKEGERVDPTQHGFTFNA